MSLINRPNTAPEVADLPVARSWANKTTPFSKLYRMPDNTLAPRISKGCLLQFDPPDDNLTGDDVVMLRTPDGSHMARLYDPAYQATHKLQVVAVMTYYHWER